MEIKLSSGHLEQTVRYIAIFSNNLLKLCCFYLYIIHYLLKKGTTFLFETFVHKIFNGFSQENGILKYNTSVKCTNLPFSSL